MADKEHAAGTADGRVGHLLLWPLFGSEESHLAHYESAVEMAATALELEPNKSFVRVQDAHALRRYSLVIGVLEAIAEGLADRVREQIDTALMIKPDNFSAHTVLANWHAAIINNSGFVNRMIYGAEEEEVFAHYAEPLGSRRQTCRYF